VKKNKQTRKIKRKGGSRLQPPLCAVRAGQRLKLVFYIGEKKETNKKNTSGQGFAPASPTPRRPRRTKE